MMKTLFSVGLGLLAALCTARTCDAQDFSVSQGALASIGLGGMKAVSDESGMQVRGSAAYVRTSSLVTISGRIKDADGILQDFSFADVDGNKDFGWFGASAKAKARVQQTSPIPVNLKASAWGSAGKSFYKPKPLAR